MITRTFNLKSLYAALQHKRIGHIVACMLPLVMVIGCNTSNPGPKPGLASVPPRPNLTYDVEQKREIVEGLIMDRDNARHVASTIRAYESLEEGDTSPLPRPEEIEFPQTASAPDTVPPALPRTVESHSQNENIEEFLEELQRSANAEWKTPTVPDTQTSPSRAESQKLASSGYDLQPGAALVVTPVTEDAAASTIERDDDSVFDVGIQSIALSGTPLLRVDFTDRDFSLSEEGKRQIGKVAQAWLQNDVGLRVLGDSVDVDLALIRASIVAEQLVNLGIDPGRIDIGVTKERLGNNAWLFDTSIIGPASG